MTQDLRAIQAGTSHHLGQNFAKAFDVTFQSAEGKLEHVYATSWGVSTRLIGTLVMAHSDDKGLVLPPKLAPIQVVFVPIARDDASREATYTECDRLAVILKSKGIRVFVDKREKESPGFKFNDWELKGACVRIELGPRDLESKSCVVAVRDSGEKSSLPIDQMVENMPQLLETIQKRMFDKALAMRAAATKRVDTWEEFEKAFEGEGGPGFILAHWDGTSETENLISEKTKATIRCIPHTPFDPEDEKPGKCILTGKPSQRRVVFAKAY
jgi:prolyl-tRNA synthetase